ncbi:hypothetical protein AgCh_030186 [Apium graveolens]
MAALPKNSIYAEDSKINGSNGIKKPGTMNYQWRPATKNNVDQFTERGLESTLVPALQISAATVRSLPPLHPTSAKKISQNGLQAAKANIKQLTNLNTTMQQDKEAPRTLIILDDARNVPPLGVAAGTAADHIGKLAEKMHDDGDKIWLPQMDDIEVVLPMNQSSSSAATSTTDHKVKITDEMLKTEEYINSALYGPRKTKRLPVFEEICPSSLFSDTENSH